MDTTTALENATQLLLEANTRYLGINTRLYDLESIVLSSNDSEDIVNRLVAVESDFEDASIQLQDSKSLLDLITKAHDKINRLVDGTIPVELQYNTDVIFNGKGTAVDKTIENKIKINNTVYGYSLGEAWLYNMAAESLALKLDATNQFNANVSGSGADKFAIWSKLQEYTNRLSLKNLF